MYLLASPNTQFNWRNEESSAFLMRLAGIIDQLITKVTMNLIHKLIGTALYYFVMHNDRPAACSCALSFLHLCTFMKALPARHA